MDEQPDSTGGPGYPPQRTAPRAERRRLTHVDRSGRPRMVDVSAKPATDRRAVAEAFVAMSPETLSLVIDGSTPKGDVLGVAELAGVMAGKKTSDLIPLCHPIGLTSLVVSVTPDRIAGGLRIRAEAATTAPTGVEMEALTAASVAALTAYDMVKGVERGVEIRAVRLLEKSGGRSGEWHRPGGSAGGEGGPDARGADGHGPDGGPGHGRGRRPGDRVAGRIRKRG
jgi:cyclic pyranopterin phosphate synthase